MRTGPAGHPELTLAPTVGNVEGRLEAGRRAERALPAAGDNVGGRRARRSPDVTAVGSPGGRRRRDLDRARSPPPQLAGEPVGIAPGRESASRSSLAPVPSTSPPRTPAPGQAPDQAPASSSRPTPSNDVAPTSSSSAQSRAPAPSSPERPTGPRSRRATRSSSWSTPLTCRSLTLRRAPRSGTAPSWDLRPTVEDRSPPLRTAYRTTRGTGMYLAQRAIPGIAPMRLVSPQIDRYGARGETHLDGCRLACSVRSVSRAAP
jgi:hypothetical protein